MSATVYPFRVVTGKKDRESPSPPSDPLLRKVAAVKERYPLVAATIERLADLALERKRGD